MNTKVIEIKNVNFDKPEVSHDIKFYPFNYQDTNLISGEFKFKPNENNSRHTVIMSSRFNIHSREENPPFPGWFVQLVGNSLSIGIGNGKTWKSVITTGKIINNDWNHVAFIIDNHAKQASIYLNGVGNTLNNITFRKPCNAVTIGALNKKGEFKFNGLVKEVKLGTELTEKKIFLNDDSSLTIDSCIKEADEYLLTIKNNLVNVNKDIDSLKKIKENILSWKYRGLEIDTTLLDNQIEHFLKTTAEFENDTRDSAEKLFILDNKINPTKNLIDKSDYITFYSSCLNNLKDDIDLLNDAVNKLSDFKGMGILLGNAFETIEQQKQNISNKIKEVRDDLKNRVDITFKFMNIVTLNEDEIDVSDT